MSAKAVRDLERMFREEGARVVHVTHTGKGTMKVTLAAPNEKQQDFFFALGTVDQYMKQKRKDVRKFVQANPATPIQVALKRVVENVTTSPTLAKIAASPPLPKPFIPFPQPPESIAQFEAVEKSIENLITPEKPEEKTVTTDTSNNGQEKRLDRKQFHQLTKWVGQNVPQGLDTTIASLTREASKGLGFPVAESTMKEALDLEEIKLAERKTAVPQDRTWAIACVLKNLMVELKLDVPEVLQAIVEKRTTR